MAYSEPRIVQASTSEDLIKAVYDLLRFYAETAPDLTTLHKAVLDIINDMECAEEGILADEYQRTHG